MPDDITALAHWGYEIAHLKQLEHSGWRFAGVSRPDSVAGHSLLVAQLAFVLAHLEGANPHTCLAMAVFHDNGETRIGDLNRVQTRYIRGKQAAERAALTDQIRPLPEAAADHITTWWEEMEAGNSLEAKVVKDADLLEQAFQARLYQSQGNQNLSTWLENIEKGLHTQSAKSLYQGLMKTEPKTWFERVKQGLA